MKKKKKIKGTNQTTNKMIQTTQKSPQQQNKKDGFQDILNQIKNFLAKLSKKEKLAYGLIILGIIFIIVGAILW